MPVVNRSIAILGLTFKCYDMPEFADAMMGMAEEYAQCDEDFTAVEMAMMLSTAGLPAAIPLDAAIGIDEDVQRMCDEGFLTLVMVEGGHPGDCAHWAVLERQGVLGMRIIDCKRVLDEAPEYAVEGVQLAGGTVVIGAKCPAMVRGVVRVD